MDYRNLQAITHRLLTALRIAEANETANPGVAEDARTRARAYVRDLEVGLDNGGWVCGRCGQELPAHVQSCSSCQERAVERAKERVDA